MTWEDPDRTFRDRVLHKSGLEEFTDASGVQSTTLFDARGAINQSLYCVNESDSEVHARFYGAPVEFLGLPLWPLIDEAIVPPSEPYHSEAARIDNAWHSHYRAEVEPYPEPSTPWTGTVRLFIESVRLP